MRGLIYREFVVQKKELTIGALTSFSLILLNILVVCSCRFGNLQNFEEVNSLWKLLGGYIFSAAGFFGLCFQSAMSSDMQSGFLRYSMTFPTPAWKYAFARTIYKSILLVISFAIYFASSAFTFTMLGDTFNTDRISILLIISELLLFVCTLSDFISSFMKSANAVKTAQMLIGTVAIILTYLLALNKTFEFQDEAGKFIAEHPDCGITENEYLIQEWTHTLQSFDSLKDALTNFFPLILLGILTLGFISTLLHYRRRNVLCRK